jgi:hypothetical protein
MSAALTGFAGWAAGCLFSVGLGFAALGREFVLGLMPVVWPVSGRATTPVAGPCLAALGDYLFGRSLDRRRHRGARRPS